MPLSDEDLKHIADHRHDFTFLTHDREIEEDRYSDGSYTSQGRGMRRRNRSVKHDKQWRNSQQERSVLRYTIGG